MCDEARRVPCLMYRMRPLTITTPTAMLINILYYVRTKLRNHNQYSLLIYRRDIPYSRVRVVYVNIRRI